jgi:predicted ArsR family transcriptional regulator
METLDAYGFSPRVEGDGYALGNCPFHALSAQLPEVVCRMNLALIAGALDAAGTRTASAHLDPAEGRCCVTVRLAHGEAGPHT